MIPTFRPRNSCIAICLFERSEFLIATSKTLRQYDTRYVLCTRYVCTWYQPAEIYTYVRYVPPVDAQQWHVWRQYIYQLSLVVATATVSLPLLYLPSGNARHELQRASSLINIPRKKKKRTRETTTGNLCTKSVVWVSAFYGGAVALVVFYIRYRDSQVYVQMMHT